MFSKIVQKKKNYYCKRNTVFELLNVVGYEVVQKWVYEEAKHGYYTTKNTVVNFIGGNQVGSAMRYSNKLILFPSSDSSMKFALQKGSTIIQILWNHFW